MTETAEDVIDYLQIFTDMGYIFANDQIEPPLGSEVEEHDELNFSDFLLRYSDDPFPSEVRIITMKQNGSDVFHCAFYSSEEHAVCTVVTSGDLDSICNQLHMEQGIVPQVIHDPEQQWDANKFETSLHRMMFRKPILNYLAKNHSID